ncbi:HAMP domain-containing protein [Pseudomonas putida]|nr:methyl-accepting chemotaxis protein [Pseudomonas putida]NTY90365.1 HAMP domain-containing protein [Pseudomonas putida]NTY98907.1 HAMP domain-containing protein [Pseudomonas putida]NTZ21190.1 HAMP domain-containing protein [Pseudomonas putida]NTZ53291.1 HAMP domain-containing protein [Pseudomonas putida]NTZ65059.1 HAMP domain-containing protein [Pseudomonas putida]
MLVGFVAWYALHESQANSAQLRSLDLLQSNLLQARIAERGFDPVKAPESAEQVARALHAVSSGVYEAEIGEPFKSAMDDSIAEYQQSFLTYAKALRQSIDARLRMQSLAEIAGQNFAGVFLDQMDTVNARLEQGQSPDESTMQSLEDAATLHQRLSNLRDSEMYFSLNPQKRFHDEWVNRISELGTALSAFSVGQDGERRHALETSRSALEDYRQAFLLYVASGEEAQAQRAAMTATAQRATRLLDEELARATSGNEVQREQLNVRLICMLALALACSIGSSMLIRRSIVAPVRLILGLARQVAAGDLQGRTPSLARRDELGQLNESVGLMMQAFRELVGRIREDVAQLDLAAGTLVEMAERTGDGVRAQRQQVTEVTDTMQNMTIAAVQVNETASDSQVILREASQMVHEGDELVRRASESLQQLSQEMIAGTNAMAVLQSQSEAITSVLDVIRTIAEQTNLLALNAAIEAARAGPHGRGFAVVADEVRALAKHTRDSTVQIEVMIQGLGEVTGEVAARLGDSRRLTVAGVRLTNRASEMLSTATRNVVRVEDSGQRILGAAQNQHLLACQVDSVTGEVERVIEQNALECIRLEDACGSLRRLSSSLSEALKTYRTD